MILLRRHGAVISEIPGGIIGAMDKRPRLVQDGLADLLACVAAFARPLEGAFDPQRFLSI